MKYAKITIAVPLADDWKEQVNAEGDEFDGPEDGRALSDKAAAAIARRRLQKELVDDSSLVNLTPLDKETSTRSADKVVVKTFRIEKEGK